MHPLVRPGIDIHSYAKTKLELPAAGSPANNRAVISKARVLRPDFDDVVLGRTRVKSQAWSHDYRLSKIPTRWGKGTIASVQIIAMSTFSILRSLEGACS